MKYCHLQQYINRWTLDRERQVLCDFMYMWELKSKQAKGQNKEQIK